MYPEITGALPFLSNTSNQLDDFVCWARGTGTEHASLDSV